MFSDTLAAQTAGLAPKANTVDVYTKKDVSTKTQADNLLNSKEGSFITTTPMLKNRTIQTGKLELMLSEDFIYSVDDKRDATQVDTQINSKLAGILTPSQIVISNSVRNQLKLTNNSATASDPCEILFSRQSKDGSLLAAMDVSGDVVRGAYWETSGTDRININCETGVVKIKASLETQVIRSDLIKRLSTTKLRIKDTVVIVGDTIVDGNIIAYH